MTLLLIKIHFRNQYFSVNQSDLKERKERIHKFFAYKFVQPDKQEMFMKNGNEGRDVLGDSRKRYRCPWAEIGK